MSTRPPKPPNPVPEEDLNLHENFSPAIAENGLIRQPKAPETDPEGLPAFLTQTDTLQDLVALRHAAQAEQEERQKPLPPKGEDVREENEKEVLHEAPPTFLTVRQAQATALVPVSKLTLARRITLLKRKRQHARRLKVKRKQRLKAAAQRANIQQAVGLQNTEQVPPQNADNLPNSRHSYRRWPWVLAILLFLLLGGISGLVPVEKIPLLRQLAYAMGFDKADTSRMSFLRALLTWTDKTIGLPGNWAEEGNQSALFARRGSDTNIPGAPEEDAVSGWNAGLTRSGGQTSLIDMKALNAMQLKKGYALDGVRGAVQVPPGREEADLGPAVIRDSDVNVRTEANRDKSEVFFGSDNSAINRNFKDGYDSTKALAKIKNPHISDGKSIDWLLNTTQQLMRTNGPLGGLNRQLESTRVSWGDGIANIGDEKPHKDLYFAWITSRMGQRTPNVMVKKSLVDTGFLGADIPMMASTALGGGVQIDSTSFQADQENWKEYLEWEKQCKETFGKEGNQITAIEEDLGTRIQSSAKELNYPENCYEATTGAFHKETFLNTINGMKKQCQQVEKSYKALEENCNMAVSWGNCNNINEIMQYESKWDTNVGSCENKLKEMCKIHNDGVVCEPAQLNNYKNDQWKKDGPKILTHFDDVKSMLTADGSEFATWIRGKEENGFWVPEDMDAKGNSKQLDNVKDTIGDGISNIFKK